MDPFIIALLDKFLVQGNCNTILSVRLFVLICHADKLYAVAAFVACGPKINKDAGAIAQF